MAEETVDEAVKTFHLNSKNVSLPDISGARLPEMVTNGKCRTTKVPVVGAHGYSPALPSQLMEVYPIEPEVAQHLSSSYGDRAWAILANSSRPTRLIPSFPILEDEVRYVIREEAACTVEDVISRRTRLSFLDANGAMKAIPRIIEIMADELNWNEARKEQELAQTVQFMKSMGLSEEKQVRSESVKPVRQEVSGVIEVGSGKLSGMLH
jgi:glycerol-3-phosphate dehydrogenase